MIASFFLGFVVKTVASLDDTISKIPILLGVTKTRKGKIAFSIGNLLAVFVSMGLALWFSSYLEGATWYRYVVAGFLLFLAGMIYFNVFTKKEPEIGKKIVSKKVFKSSNFFVLVLLGFVISLIALLDDTVVFIPVFAADFNGQIFAAAGIVISTILQILAVIVFAEQLQRFRYKKVISVGGLLIFAALLLIGWI